MDKELSILVQTLERIKEEWTAPLKEQLEAMTRERDEYRTAMGEYAEKNEKLKHALMDAAFLFEKSGMIYAAKEARRAVAPVCYCGENAIWEGEDGYYCNTHIPLGQRLLSL